MYLFNFSQLFSTLLSKIKCKYCLKTLIWKFDKNQSLFSSNKQLNRLKCTKECLNLSHLTILRPLVVDKLFHIICFV